jgi:hypothetical protein
MSNKDKELELLDAQLAKYERLLAVRKEIYRLQMVQAERHLRMTFAALVAQSLYLWEKYPACKGCEKAMDASACLEAREKTGKCYFEVDFVQLQTLPWPTSKGEEAAE